MVLPTRRAAQLALRPGSPHIPAACMGYHVEVPRYLLANHFSSCLPFNLLCVCVCLCSVPPVFQCTFCVYLFEISMSLYYEFVSGLLGSWTTTSKTATRLPRYGLAASELLTANKGRRQPHQRMNMLGHTPDPR